MLTTSPACPPPTRPFSVLSTARAAEAVAVARDVALRLLDRDYVQAAVRETQLASPSDADRWVPASVARGDVGLALMCAAFDAALPDEGWDVAAHDLLCHALGPAVDSGTPVSLFDGLAGIAFTVAQLSRGGTRYVGLIDQLDAKLLPGVRGMASYIRASDSGIAVSAFDVISGLAGTCAYLLDRRDDARVRETLDSALVALIALTDPKAPRWHTPTKLISNETLARRYQGGAVDIGLAHGIPGPLAAMALAMLAGHDVLGLAESVAHSADFLVRECLHDEWGPVWPAMVARGAHRCLPVEPCRSGWCYGAGGVARALWLASRALKDKGLGDFALESVRGCQRRPATSRSIESPTFCHGVSGLLQITLRFAAETEETELIAGASDLLDELLAAYDQRSPLGYMALMPFGARQHKPGVLDGAAGVAMVLLAAAIPTVPSWDRLFLLS